MRYDIARAVEYAHRWAFARNPKYYDFEKIGGDCTNFISQCIYAGCGLMNYTPETGWFYHSQNARSASWTGVEFLYSFLLNNRERGPYGHKDELWRAEPGDIIQLALQGTAYVHSLFVVSVGAHPEPDNILIATHSYDSDYRPLNTYDATARRLIKIDGARP